MPPTIDPALVQELSALVREIDLLPEGQASTQIGEFNDRAGTQLSHVDFREYFASQSSAEFALEHVLRAAIRPTNDISRAELVELTRRCIPTDHNPNPQGYEAVMRANGAGEVIGWIYWPPDWDAGSQTWGGGLPLSEYDPEPEELVDRFRGSGVDRNG